MSNASVVADFPQSEKPAAAAPVESGQSRASRDHARYKKSFDLVGALKIANTQTGKRKVIAFLSPYFKDKYGIVWMVNISAVQGDSANAPEGGETSA